MQLVQVVRCVGMLEAVPVVLVVCYGAATIKVCYCTAFVAVSGGGMDYFCTVPTLHRRRRWIMAGGGEAGGRRHGAHVVRLAGGLAGRYPPLDSEGWDDMSVWLAEIFF